jgi:glycine/D-amino acid oxidase-like deaminating enzyme
MWQLGLRGLRWGNSGCWCATVPAGTVHADVVVVARAARAREGRPGALPTAGQERRVLFFNSCLKGLIHLLSLYREV